MFLSTGLCKVQANADNTGDILQFPYDETKSRKLDIGDPITIEFKYINIKGSFDLFGKSEIMIVNNIKTTATKEKAVDIVVYYDDDAEIKKDTWNVGPFNPDEYGNPVCYYNAGYRGETISMITKAWEIDRSGPVEKVFGTLRGIFKAAESFSPYFELADIATGFTSRIVKASIDHDQFYEYAMEFRTGTPIGTYVCIPDIKDDLPAQMEIIKNYRIINNRLYKDGSLREYDGSYFIFEFGTQEREDLSDFDYVNSSADLLGLLHEGDNSSADKLLEMTKNSNDFKTLQRLKEIMGDKKLYKAHYNHLSEDGKALIEENF
jgi:hypothetical protein